MYWFEIGKRVNQAVFGYPAYLASMQSTSCKMPGWIKHKLESRLPREITTSDMQMIYSNGKKLRETKGLLGEGERREKNLTSNSIFNKLRSLHPVPSLHGK